MNALSPWPLTPAEVRMLRQLGVEVRLCISTACLNPQRFKPFIGDARIHLQLLRDLVRAVNGGARTETMASLARDAHLALLCASGRRHSWKGHGGFHFCWLHRLAFCERATQRLVAFDTEARRLEAELWEE